MKNSLIAFLKKDVVLCAALLLAVISAFFVHPSIAYLSYIDFRVLGILLSLMLVMECYKANGVFARIGRSLISRCKSTRSLCAVLVFLCFFSSMLLTNDVALITFVPFALLTLKLAGLEKQTMYVVILQTIAANLGSMLTPMGNPQNLYLYGLSGMGMGEFILLMLPYSVVSGVLLLLCLFRVNAHGTVSGVTAETSDAMNKKQVMICSILFLVCILCVMRVIDWRITLLITVVAVAIMNAKLLLKADWALLLTFIGFFVFIGNMGAIPQVRDALAKIIGGNEFFAAVLSSQVISNVPAALLLSGFTTDTTALILGTNIGGLGTLIASMASLISYKQIANAYPREKGKYLLQFTLMNVVFLALLIVFKLIFTIK